MNGIRWTASIALAIAPVPTLAAAPTAPSAPQIVQSALEAEVASDGAGRSRLLADAVAADASCSPAHWCRGELRQEGVWRPLEEVERHAAADIQRDDYRRLIADLASEPAVDRDRELAAWCSRHALVDEAKYHWRRVLDADASDVEAQRALGLILHDGRLVAREEIAGEDARRRQEKAAFEELCETYRKLVREAGTDDGRRAAFLDSLRKTRESDAFGPLIQVISYEAPQRDRGPLAKLPVEGRRQFVLELHEALLAALAEMPQREATLDLVHYALFAPAAEVRRWAAEGLKRRPATDYVPLVMEEMAAPIEADADLVASADGTAILTLNRRQEGLDGVDVQRTIVEQASRRQPSTRSPRFPAFPQTARLNGIATQALANVAQTNQRIEFMNLRAAETLTFVTGKNGSWSTRQWWNAWAQFNELVVNNHPEGENVTVINNFYIQMMSCFVAGTPVWTRTGPTPIERIRPGDFVLSQDPVTGELAYRPVMQTTIRPPSPIVRLALPDETIETTRGHRFWIVGHGWEMAKFLKAGTALHGVHGAVPLVSATTLGKEDEAEAYNLVVDGFHTYFVGENRLLVHDNGCPAPTRSPLPGMRPAVDWFRLAPNHNWLAAATDHAGGAMLNVAP